MDMRALGNSGLAIAPLMLGGNVFGWTADEATSFALLDRFVAAGLNAIDTADTYSRWVPGHKGGESETVIGRWLKARGGRDKVVIATKVGNEMPGFGKGLSRAHVLRSCEASLQRLQTDYIDLYQSHVDDSSVAQEETLGAYQTLIEQGKVRAIGASNFSAARLSDALAVSQAKRLPRYESLQPHYNLYERADYERDLEPLVLKEKIGVIPYYGLAGGFLTGKYRTQGDAGKSPRAGGAMSKLNPRGVRILAALDEVAARTNSKPASVALAWLMARPSITAPIASATTQGQLDDLIAATRLKLDRDAIRALDAASAA
ncbi:MAG TPA: aldo/keto reductase [Hyphomicrobiaceae bacterium]|jgi:aryl-alcohol dehydrogenase-like predicted oxidoreductase|nr:aldo/keto reductase [Hyphomicrobiaceae bacterium]